MTQQELLAQCAEIAAEAAATPTFWLVVGFTGQALFSARFIIQWLYSEKHKRSIIPLAFWFFSIGGGAVLFAYALYRQDPVFIAGQGAGLVIYARNLYLIYQEKKQGKLKTEPISNE